LTTIKNLDPNLPPQQFQGSKIRKIETISAKTVHFHPHECPLLRKFKAIGDDHIGDRNPQELMVVNKPENLRLAKTFSSGYNQSR
jgi:hypothetical protein